MKTDINIIAEKCNVSKATVSRVFTGRGSVSKAIKEKVLKVARELNYTPKQVASREIISIVVNSIDDVDRIDRFRNILLLKLVARITRIGYLVNIIGVRDINKILDSYTKVTILLLNEMEVAEYWEKIKSVNTPMVVLGDKIDNCNSIYPNYGKEISTAIDYLVENGHRRISILLDSPKGQASLERMQGYIKSVCQHGLRKMTQLPYRIERQSLMETIALILKDDPSALIICGESIVSEAVNAMELLDIRVPQDLSVITFEKSGISRWFSPPHTTIDQNASLLVDETIDLINAIISGRLSGIIYKKLSAKLNIRNSVSDIRKASESMDTVMVKPQT